MKTMTLLLKTATGDELRLAVPGVQVAATGESPEAALRPQLQRQMDDVCQAVQECLSAEGLETILGDFDLRFAMSEALLTQEDEEIVVSLPVRESAQEPKLLPGLSENPDLCGLPADWDALFSLNEQTEEGG